MCRNADIKADGLVDQGEFVVVPFAWLVLVADPYFGDPEGILAHISAAVICILGPE